MVIIVINVMLFVENVMVLIKISVKSVIQGISSRWILVLMYNVLKIKLNIMGNALLHVQNPTLMMLTISAKNVISLVKFVQVYQQISAQYVKLIMLY